MIIHTLLQVFAALHFIALGMLSFYGIHRLWLLFWWFKERQTLSPMDPPAPLEDPPLVTVQLPLYNEQFVAARLIDAAARLDWPKDRLEIQVLDDSTDRTRSIVDERAAFWKAHGVRVEVIRRADREGFKAGALAQGLIHARGEFIAVFDADFLPAPDFLTRTVPFFSDPRVGMVQARWGFLNAGHSWFTFVQSWLLGQHFDIEHLVRFKRGLFFNFNGTAGIWRKKTIESAGGWRSDTVTEDLDLSYRAQLAGWRFIYLPGLVVPSELPVTLSDFRSQQERWAKGSLQTARKILPRLIRAALPLRIKVEAIAHLLANLGWLLCALVILTLYPALFYRAGIGPYQFLRFDLPLSLGASGVILFYFFAYVLSGKDRSPLSRFALLPLLSIGLAPSLALAVLKGLIGEGGEFVRTPKFGLVQGASLPRPVLSYHRPASFHLFLNTALFAYSLLPLTLAWQRNTWAALPFLLIFPLGFLLVIIIDFKEQRRKRA
jgi:cellulose synthase/poly-beta-1,6-N-acetylglucosamine synthase-like glycosyltransferase